MGLYGLAVGRRSHLGHMDWVVNMQGVSDLEKGTDFDLGRTDVARFSGPPVSRVSESPAAR